MKRELGHPVVAIIGRPNVGKSALFNRLIGRNIAIVHDQPGVTRDRLSAICIRGRRPFTLLDTGGIGGTGESELTGQVRRVVEQAIRDSDVVVFMVDAQHGLSPLDEELARFLRKLRKPIILAINKVDHAKHEDLASDFASLGFPNSVVLSAAHGVGVSDLIELIEPALPMTESEPARAPVSDHESLALAIVGRPNVGKSSFINSIVQSERALVSELPGTTRDAVDISYQRNGNRFVFIDTAGMRKRHQHSNSVEVFSVMRSERTIRRADICVLLIDVVSGVTAQDKTIAGLIQKARKAAILVVNKFDLVKTKKGAFKTIQNLVQQTQERLFFLNYAPVLVVSALTGDHVEKVFRLIKRIERAARARIGTGVLNRKLRNAFAANPPPMVSGRRLKLLYVTQTGASEKELKPPEFVLFVNDPKLLNQNYRRYLEGRIREIEPYEGLPILLTCRARRERR